MQTIKLIPHPKALPKGVSAVEVDIGFAGEGLLLRYAVAHDGGFNIPMRQGRLDDLWQTTCFEIFARDGAGPGYIEVNFAPNNAWAACCFTSERQGMHNFDMAPPAIAADRQPERFELTATIQRAALPASLGLIGVSAVIEELDGTKSYWALHHPNPDKPDFHDPACFTLDLSPARIP